MICSTTLGYILTTKGRTIWEGNHMPKTSSMKMTKEERELLRLKEQQRIAKLLKEKKKNEAK